MQILTDNPCIRCGRPRILVKKWTEKVGEATLTFTSSTCQDANCQKQVDKINDERESKRTYHMQKRKQLALSSQINRSKPKN